MHADKFARVEIVSVEEFWQWLEAHHRQEESIWLVTYKAACPERYVSREEVLDGLIAFGWTDGRRMKLDEKRTMQLVSPRKQHIWAESYKQRAERLEAEGRMKPSGHEAIRRSKKAGLWDAMNEVDELAVPEDLAAALRSRKATNWWNMAAPSYRRNVLRWIASAKKAETRSRRVEEVSDRAAMHEKVPNY